MDALKRATGTGYKITPMPFPENPRPQRRLRLAIAISLLLHGLVLLVPQQPPRGEERPAPRLQARLAPRAPTPPAAVPAPAAPAVSAVPAAAPAKPRARRRILAIAKPKGPAASPTTPEWSVAEKEDMNRFLDELDQQPRPDLAQRSLAMARDLGRQQARQDEAEDDTLELVPGSPPVDAFSLEMYLDALVKKLNRSAAFARNDPRSKGVRTGAVRVRLNPNGSLKSFEVLYAADQQGEIEFIRKVVERAVPFSPFPADIGKSARSLAMLICIMPTNAGGGGFGFTRQPGGRGC